MYQLVTECWVGSDLGDVILLKLSLVRQAISQTSMLMQFAVCIADCFPHASIALARCLPHRFKIFHEISARHNHALAYLYSTITSQYITGIFITYLVFKIIPQRR